MAKSSRKASLKLVPSECLERYLVMLQDKLTDDEEKIYRSVGEEVTSLKSVVELFGSACAIGGVLSLDLNVMAKEAGKADFPDHLDDGLQLLLTNGYWEKAHRNLSEIKELLESKAFRLRQIAELEKDIAHMKERGM